MFKLRVEIRILFGSDRGRLSLNFKKFYCPEKNSFENFHFRFFPHNLIPLNDKRTREIFSLEYKYEFAEVKKDCHSTSVCWYKNTLLPKRFMCKWRVSLLNFSPIFQKNFVR